MHSLIRKLLGEFDILTAFLATTMIIGTIGVGTYVLASYTSEFQQTINAGTLTPNIVDSAYAAVASPTVAMTAVTFSFACQTATGGTFGNATTDQLIYVSNPDAADNGWTLTVAPTNTTDYWDSVGTDFDFNDDGGSGCTDSAVDVDSLGGQMTVNATSATITAGLCSACNATTGMSKGGSTSYVEGTTNTATLMASDGSQDIGDWTLKDVAISQKIPAEQPAASDYTISMVLTATAT